MKRLFCILALLLAGGSVLAAEEPASGSAFFEKRIRPVLVEHCHECHSEEAGEQKGGLLLDREMGWLRGGNTQQAVVPGEPEASLMILAVRGKDPDLAMPPKHRLDPDLVRLLEHWVRIGAPGPVRDLGDTAFSRLGDQGHLFGQARDHWAFQAVQEPKPGLVADAAWNASVIDRLVYARLAEAGLTPSRPAEPAVLFRRLNFDLTGLPPAPEAMVAFQSAAAANRPQALVEAVDALLESPAFGEHLARMWLDVARYADTDSSYRPDTKTPRYLPFAFAYRDYVIDAFNADKPFARFIREQLAADLMDLPPDAPELAALGFLSVGPHLKRQDDCIDDWIDVTTRGLMGLTVACARCHDHKFEPVPTADYYSLYGVFASVRRSDPLEEERMPQWESDRTEEERAEYESRRAQVDAAIRKAGDSKAKGNNRSVAEKIMETDLAELLTFHPGAPVRAMVVSDVKRPVDPYVFIRGQRGARGDKVPRRFLKILDPEQGAFPSDTSGRMQMVDRIVDPANPLTARVFVNRVWGYLTGKPLVATPSDFGLQGESPTHPELLDWLAADFLRHDGSVKHLVRTMVLSRTYQQRSDHRPDMAQKDPENRLLWRAHRRRLGIEVLHDTLLATAGRLDRRLHGRSEPLWGEDYTRRRALYGYIDRFNLDPTLRAFDFPSPMQSQADRPESIVAPQALFLMNAPFVVDQAIAVTRTPRFQECATDDARAEALFEIILQRPARPPEVLRLTRFVESQQRFFPGRDARMQTPWPVAAQSLYMSNEFQYVD